MPKFTLPKSTGARILLCMLAVLCLIGVLGTAAVGIINGIVVSSTDQRILTADEAVLLTDVDYIIVLGAGVKADGTPSDMLHDRVLTGTHLVQLGLDSPLLMSGDNQRPDYDEVSAMVSLATRLGVEQEQTETDRLGLSTYDSLSRAATLYDAKRVIIITQTYHLYRALYIAEQLGLDAYGVSADVRSYRGQLLRDVREIAARCKDFLLVQLDER